MPALEAYREFDIYPDYAGFWRATHKDYDGPEDYRTFLGKSPEDVKAIIDDYWDDQTEPTP